MKCDKCKKDVVVATVVHIENHILCQSCFKLWAEFLKLHRKPLDKFDGRKRHRDWCDCWERIYAKFLEDDKIYVQFT